MPAGCSDGLAATATPRRLDPSDAAAFRDLRLLALRTHPEAFGASCEEEAEKPVEWFAARLASNAVWGGVRPGRPGLLGMAGLQLGGFIKTRHKGVLWGMFVRPEAQRQGLAAALAGAALDHARTVVEEVRLSVVTSNAAAIALYRRLGFETYAVEPRALKVGDAYLDEMLMALRF